MEEQNSVNSVQTVLHNSVIQTKLQEQSQILSLNLYDFNEFSTFLEQIQNMIKEISIIENIILKSNIEQDKQFIVQQFTERAQFVNQYNQLIQGFYLGQKDIIDHKFALLQGNTKLLEDFNDSYQKRIRWILQRHKLTKKLIISLSLLSDNCQTIFNQFIIQQ